VNRKFSYTAIVMVGLVLVVGLVFGLWKRKSNLEMEKLKSENSKMFTEKSALSGEVSLLTTQINERDREVANLRTKEQTLDRLRGEIGELKDAKEEYMAKLEEAEKYRLQLDKLNQANRESQEQINTLLDKINKGKAHTRQLGTERLQLTDQLKQIKNWHRPRKGLSEPFKFETS